MLHTCLDESAALRSVFHCEDAYRLSALRPFLMVDPFADAVTKHIGAVLRYEFVICVDTIRSFMNVRNTCLSNSSHVVVGLCGLYSSALLKQT